MRDPLKRGQALLIAARAEKKAVEGRKQDWRNPSRGPVDPILSEASESRARDFRHLESVCIGGVERVYSEQLDCFILP